MLWKWNRFPLILLCALGCTMAAPASVDDLSQRILANTLATHYPLAAAQADSLQALDAERGCFYRAMVRLSQFDDLGDTLVLAKAKQIVESCTPGQQFWESLRLFQLGFIQAENGSTMNAALTTRKAAKGFLEEGTLEARGFHSIYAYYLDGATAWIPFTTDRRPSLLKTLDSARLVSPTFWPLFSTSLAWMYFDRKEYQLALRVVEQALTRCPGHPVYFQMKGDMFFRLKRYEEAAAVYEQSLRDYSRRAHGSVRWWCAAGNLLRIYHAMGRQGQVKQGQQAFQSADFAKVRPRMPASLVKALEDADLID